MNETEWVAIKDQMPESGLLVLTCNMKAQELRDFFMVAWQADGVWLSNAIKPTLSPTHWMHLPYAPVQQRLKQE